MIFLERCIQLSLAREKSVNRPGELVASMKELKLEKEDETEELAAHLLDQFTSGLSRAT